MSHTFAITEKCVIGGVAQSEVNSLTSGQRVSIDDSVPVANDQLFALSLDVSQVKAIYISSDQDLTLETNSSSAPAQTLNLKANIPYIWYTNKYHPLVFTTDITAPYI